MPLKTLFLNPPSFENFDGGAGSRWPATREIESYWYPVWLAYPAGMLEGARLLDAPPHHISAEETIEIAKDYEFLVLFTSTPGFPGDIGLARAIKEANPKIKIAFVGPHVTVLPEKSLRDCPAIDFVCRKEFDYSVVDYAKGKPLEEIPGISFLKDGKVVHNPDAPQIQDLDALPHVTDIYKRDLDVTRYNVPFLLHPYVSLYTTRGCPAQCTFCLWPQTLSGHPWRKRSTDDVAARNGQGQRILAGSEGILLRRRYLQHPEGAHHRTVRQAEAAGADVVLHFARHHRLRNAEGHEGSRLPAADRGLRVRRSADSEEHQERRNRRARPPVHQGLPQAGLVVHGDFILGLPGETHETINNTIAFAKELDVETIQVSVAHAYPGTELYDYAVKNGFMVGDNKMVDEGGHQLAHIQYPGLPADDILAAVHRFYDEYYFRPKAVFRILRKAVFDSNDRKRLYKEAKSFLKLRARAQ